MSFYWMKDPVFKLFILRYAIFTPLLIALINFEGYSPLYFITELHTQFSIACTAAMVNFFETPITIIGNQILLSHGRRLLILNECNGLIPILLYSAALLAYPTYYVNKIKWFFIGYVLLVLTNILRIYAITLTTLLSPQYFHLAHDIIGRYTIGVLTLVLFILFVRHVSIQRNIKFF